MQQIQEHIHLLVQAGDVSKNVTSHNCDLKNEKLQLYQLELSHEAIFGITVKKSMEFLTTKTAQCIANSFIYQSWSLHALT